MKNAEKVLSIVKNLTVQAIGQKEQEDFLGQFDIYENKREQTKAHLLKGLKNILARV